MRNNSETDQSENILKGFEQEILRLRNEELRSTHGIAAKLFRGFHEDAIKAFLIENGDPFDGRTKFKSLTKKRDNVGGETLKAEKFTNHEKTRIKTLYEQGMSFSYVAAQASHEFKKKVIKYVVRKILKELNVPFRPFGGQKGKSTYYGED